MIGTMEGSTNPVPPATPPPRSGPSSSAQVPPIGTPNAPAGSPSPSPTATPGPNSLSPQVAPLQPATTAKKHTNIRTLFSVVVFIGAIIIAATLINQFVFQSYYVDGTSMTPTLQNNDRLIIDKVERTSAMLRGQPYIPKRGQVVVLDSSLVDQYGRNEQLIKRVIGLPGETVIIGNDGIVTIKNSAHPDGFNVNEALGLKLDPTYIDTPIAVKVPERQVFVMGDNRGPGGSFDSRAFGPVDTNKVQGRLLARIFPLNKTGFF